MPNETAARLEEVTKRYGQVTALDGAGFLLDIEMPGMDGLAAAAALHEAHLWAAIRKTGARSRLEALRTAEDKGWL